MKTTIEIPDSILEEAKKVAARERTTIKTLVVEGLRRTLSEKKRKHSFSLRKATFKGKGLHPQITGASWDQIRDLAYEREK